MMGKGRAGPGRPATNSRRRTGQAGSSVEVDHLPVVPGGQPGQRDEVGGITQEPDRPVPEEHVHPATMWGDERDVRPFAPPLVGTASADAGDAVATRPAGLPVDLIADGGVRLAAGVMIRPHHADSVPVAAAGPGPAEEAAPGRGDLE